MPPSGWTRKKFLLFLKNPGAVYRIIFVGRQRPPGTPPGGPKEGVGDGVTVITKERFTELVLQYERLVYTVCFQLVRDAATAEDLTQETFLSAYIHREAIPEGYERQWLSRVAANKAKDHLQSAWNRRTVLPGEEELADRKSVV